MSARSARALASQRQTADPKKSAAGTIPPEAETGTEPVKGLDALVAVIPSETFVFYTPIVAAIVAQLLKDAPAPDRYMGFRWAVYAAAILVAMALIAKDRLLKSKTKFPTAEMLVAGLAFAVWGLVTPESPLLAETKDTLDLVIIATISGGGVLLVGMISSVFLTKKAK